MGLRLTEDAALLSDSGWVGQEEKLNLGDVQETAARMCRSKQRVESKMKQRAE